METPKEQVIMTYVGVCHNTVTNTLRHQYMLLPEDWENKNILDNPQTKVFDKKFSRPYSPGTVFSIDAEVSDKGMIVYRDSMKILGRVPKKIADTWQDISNAIQDTYTLQNALQNKSNQELVDLLAPIKDRYNKLRTHSQKTVFLARITAIITGR